ncbi:hypothetical protein [Nonomuraea roseoviolacea]|uniref:Signal transduction histidine kinase n=1 Tax=Nonomuraea roseoviolacea subsp. carminata TaxID=160689 RepID=A0ABT1JWF6_9ACTN|nr:hypothetical protein [Nonomuraea roseoviolacea]MCP2345684.1 signal transduction histidine kinase [Nonomuraea roseoviolacea subsp. carminata]
MRDDDYPSGHVRIGYARASIVRQSLDTQLDALEAARRGLAIVQAVAEAHEGRVEAANQWAEAGAVVRIVLPR